MSLGMAILSAGIISVAGIAFLSYKGHNFFGGDMAGSITINGHTFHGSKIQVKNGRIIVDGVDVTDQTGVDTKHILSIHLQGDVTDVVSDKSVNVDGDVKGSINASGSVTCDNVGGDIKAGGSDTCDAVKGTVMANGSVTCDDVGGSVSAGGSVNYG